MNCKSINLKNFIDLSYDEKMTILYWRNSKEVRSWMYTNDIISEENHLNFIESLIESNTKKYFSVLRDNVMLGVIYLTDIDYNRKNCEFGLYSNPTLMGVGKILIQLIINEAFKNLKLKKLGAEVFSNNKKAISLYLKNGFIERKRKKIEDKEIIYMELTQ